jgi:hypothetical protein
MYIYICIYIYTYRLITLDPCPGPSLAAMTPFHPSRRASSDLGPYTNICMYIYLYIYVYIHIYIYICKFVQMYVYIYIHIHTHTCIHIHTHINTYIYIYTHLHIKTCSMIVCKTSLACSRHSLHVSEFGSPLLSVSIFQALSNVHRDRVNTWQYIYVLISIYVLKHINRYVHMYTPTYGCAYTYIHI